MNKNLKQVFVADTHFGHDKYHSENWEYKFWKQYNAIQEDFILYHLGDLSFKNNHKYLDDIFRKFRANKYCKNIVLILGNHDAKPSKYLQHGVVACYSMVISYKYKWIRLTHEPIENAKLINIHGHLHSKEESHRSGYMLNDNNVLVESEKIYYIENLVD